MALVDKLFKALKLTRETISDAFDSVRKQKVSIESLDEFSQITKIGSRYYGVCSDECYNTWLNTPAAQCLAPINDYVTLSRLRDNQQ